MTNADFFISLQWWLTIFIIGLGFLPTTLIIFRSFFDKGYIFTKTLGMIILSYLIFVLGVLHIAPFTVLSILLVFFMLVTLQLFFLTKPSEVILHLKQHWKILLGEEVLFFLSLLFWTYIRGFNQDIHGLEKYMDFGFVNSILRTEYFPPKDMWFTPFSINYYYFGHIVTAVLTKLSNLQSNYTYNLMIATLFGLCCISAFSIGANAYTFIFNKNKFSATKQLLSGGLTALLVTLAGNLHILYAFFTAYPNEKPAPLWQLVFHPELFPNGYWYPNATRFIFNTIHEFPIYSWVVSDLHGHVLDIPVVLLTVAFLFSLFINQQTKTQKIQPFFQQVPIRFWHLPFIGFLLAVMYMTNAWDGAIYLLLAGLVLLTMLWKCVPITTIIITLLSIIVSFLLFSLPYNYFFKPFASGIGVLCAPDALTAMNKIGPFLFEKNHCQHSPWWQLLHLYGFFFFFITAFFIFIAKLKKLLQIDKFMLLLTILGLLLILIPEFIYVKDIYPAHYRANTMFKLVFQAFMLLSIVSAYSFVRIVSSITYPALSVGKRIIYTLYLIVATILILLVLIYPQLAIDSYYGDLKTYKGINGTAYLATLYPNDTEAINWLNKHVSGQPVILEAQSDSYTDFGRVSVHTGLPTVLGWTVHEWLWRGDYSIPAPRIDEIKRMYETTDSNETKSLLQKYHVEYVFIGALEYQKYPQIQEDMFTKLGKVVFQKGSTKIYQIN
jgi:uncharacterized membrane protein